MRAHRRPVRHRRPLHERGPCAWAAAGVEEVVEFRPRRRGARGAARQRRQRPRGAREPAGVNAFSSDGNAVGRSSDYPLQICFLLGRPRRDVLPNGSAPPRRLCGEARNASLLMIVFGRRMVWLPKLGESSACFACSRRCLAWQSCQPLSLFPPSSTILPLGAGRTASRSSAACASARGKHLVHDGHEAPLLVESRQDGELAGVRPHEDHVVRHVVAFLAQGEGKRTPRAGPRSSRSPGAASWPKRALGVPFSDTTRPAAPQDFEPLVQALAARTRRKGSRNRGAPSRSRWSGSR